MGKKRDMHRPVSELEQNTYRNADDFVSTINKVENCHVDYDELDYDELTCSIVWKDNSYLVSSFHPPAASRTYH